MGLPYSSSSPLEYGNTYGEGVLLWSTPVPYGGKPAYRNGLNAGEG
jgi:hypothetical protein